MKGMYYFIMKKHIATALIASIVIAALAMPAVAAPGIITADALNIRTAPSTSSASIGLLYNGTTIDLGEKVGSWYKITYKNSPAYIHANYVTEGMASAQTMSADAAQIIEIAKKYIGTPYVYGGSSPSGFDCSGFVKYVFAQAGISLPRTADVQAKEGIYVSYENLQPGDLVCFGSSSINHIGIYVGNGQYIHSPRTGYTVCIASLTERYKSGSFRFGRRILK